MNDNPYLPPQVPSGPATSKRYSGLGIAAFSIAIVIVLVEVVLIAITAVMERSGRLDENSSPVLGLGMIAVGFLALTPIGLGIAALFQRGRKKLLPVLGIAISVFLLAAISGLVVWATLSD